MNCPFCGQEDTARLMTDHYGRPYVINLRAVVRKGEASRVPGTYVPDGRDVTGWICDECGSIRLTVDADDRYPADPDCPIPAEEA